MGVLSVARTDSVMQPEPWCGVRRTEADSDSATRLLCGLGLATASLWASLSHK